jgi:hypothetical protein
VYTVRVGLVSPIRCIGHFSAMAWDWVLNIDESKSVENLYSESKKRSTGFVNLHLFARRHALRKPSYVTES